MYHMKNISKQSTRIIKCTFLNRKIIQQRSTTSSKAVFIVVTLWQYEIQSGFLLVPTATLTPNESLQSGISVEPLCGAVVQQKTVVCS